MHYYQFNIGDYASHTRHLTLLEDLAYRLLLDLYYLHEKPLNGCFATVARSIGMREHVEEVEAVVREFFEPVDGCWINPRADREIEKYRTKSEQASRAGKASAERKLNARSTPVTTDVQPNINQEPLTINHKPVTKNQEPKTNTPGLLPVVNQEPSQKPSAEAKASTTLNREIWESYAKAYFSKYGTDPVRNATVNGQIAQLGKRLGDEAVHVAGWFPNHRSSWYSQKMHSVGSLLADCEKLRTEWATNTQMTQAKARDVDRSSGGGNVFLRLMNEGKI